MRNNRIRLSESQLHRVINDSVYCVLAEEKNDMLTLGNEALVMLHKLVRTKYPQMSQSRLNLEVEWLIGELYSRICDRKKAIQDMENKKKWWKN